MRNETTRKRGHEIQDFVTTVAMQELLSNLAVLSTSNPLI